MATQKKFSGKPPSASAAEQAQENANKSAAGKKAQAAERVQMKIISIDEYDSLVAKLSELKQLIADIKKISQPQLIGQRTTRLNQMHEKANPASKRLEEAMKIVDEMKTPAKNLIS